MLLRRFYESLVGEADPYPKFDLDKEYGLDLYLGARSRAEINEWSLGHLYQLINEPNIKDTAVPYSKNKGQQVTRKGDFAILTSWKGGYVTEVSGESVERAVRTPEEQEKMDAYNDRRFSALRQDLRGMGYSPIDIVGHGQEPDENGKLTPTKERAFFVPGMRLAEATELAKKYDQWGIVYGGRDLKGKPPHWIAIVSCEGEEADSGRFHPTRIGDYYSEIRKLRDAAALHKVPGPEEPYTRTGKKRRFFTVNSSPVVTGVPESECLVLTYHISGVGESQYASSTGMGYIEGIREGFGGRATSWGPPRKKIEFQVSEDAVDEVEER